MLGQELRYQNGFDCQGLWVEVEVEKDLKLRSKRDIENLVPGDSFASIDRFVQLCKERVDKFAKIQTEQSIRLGYWMDWDQAADWAKPPDERRSYFTMSEANNYTIWSFLKKAHDRGLVYRGFDAMPWCPRCGVGISQMEMNEGYRVIAHRAVFVRFPLGRPGENLLVWTTTPWTLTSNVGQRSILSCSISRFVKAIRSIISARLRSPRSERRRVQEQGRVGRRRSQAQIAGTALQRKEGRLRILGELKAPTWSAGLTTALSTSCRPSTTTSATRTNLATVVDAKAGRRASVASRPIALSLGRM